MDISNTLKFLDIFGTKFNLYIESKPKFYTSFGGLSSLFLLVINIYIFYILSIGDFKRLKPTITTSEYHLVNPKKIKFGDEKLYIPFRMVDYNEKYIDHKNLFYPKITYFYAEKDKNLNYYPLKRKNLGYKLCNETSMRNLNKKIYIIEDDLSTLYCIDMEGIWMGGGFTSDFVYYVELELYLCKDGKNYNASDSDCTSIQKLQEIAGKNNSFLFQFKYPVVQIRPKELNTPVNVYYFEMDYHLSKTTNKRQRIYLRENVFNDDTTFFFDRKKNTSYWGLNSYTADDYMNNLNDQDLIAEGSNSRLYSLCIYMDRGITVYERSYKNIFEIFASYLPILSMVYSAMKIIIKIFKLSLLTKDLTETFFENVPANIDDILKPQSRKSLFILNKNYKASEMKPIELPFFKYPKKEMSKSHENQSSFHSGSIIIKEIDSSSNSSSSKNKKKELQKLNIKNSDNSNNSINNKSIVNSSLVPMIPLNLNQAGSSKIKNFLSLNKPNTTSELNKKHINISQKCNNNLLASKEQPKNINSDLKDEALFPFRYYIFSLFKCGEKLNVDQSCFSKKYIKVHNFMCLLFDIKNYLSLIKEFTILKSNLIENKIVEPIKTNNKININKVSFFKDINNCISNKTLALFTK